MDKNFSNKIANINVILTIIVVLLHSNCMLYVTNVTSSIDMLQRIINSITSIAVPTFFAISSYLFFRNYNLSKTKSKFLSRLKSLTIPYLIWNVIFFLFVVALDKLHILSSMDNIIGSLDYSPGSIFKYIFSSRFDGPLWYARELMILILMSPIIYIIVKKIKKFSLTLLPVFFMMNIIFTLDYESFSYWLFIYYGSAYISINYHSSIDIVFKKLKKSKYFIYLIYALLLFINATFYENYIIFLIYRIFSPIFILTLLTEFNSLSNAPNKYAKYTFFTFCVHNWICVITKRLTIMVFGNSALTCFIMQFPTWIISIVLIIIIINIMKKVSPKLLLILNGSRNER